MLLKRTNRTYLKIEIFRVSSDKSLAASLITRNNSENKGWLQTINNQLMNSYMKLWTTAWHRSDSTSVLKITPTFPILLWASPDQSQSNNAIRSCKAKSLNLMKTNNSRKSTMNKKKPIPCCIKWCSKWIMAWVRLPWDENRRQQGRKGVV